MSKDKRKKIKSKQVNKATTLLLSKKKPNMFLGGLQQYQQPQQQGSVTDQKGEQQANALVSGVGAINPIIGAALKVGQGIGKQTMDADGLYSSRAGAFIDNSVNPTTGITNLKDLPKALSNATSGKEKVSLLANQLSLGLVGKSATQERRKKERASRQIQAEAAKAPELIANARLAKGGKLASKLKVESGGQLNQVSEDAVEVQAFNPSQTDSVELENAFVDHNEIIDNQNRVFSDSIIAPSGRTVAKEAKRLEKMKGKNTSSRFNDFNEYINSKLDNLFAYQEEVKQAYKFGGKLKKGYDNGGVIDPTNPERKKLREVKSPKEHIQYDWADVKLNNEILANKAGQQYKFTRTDFDNFGAENSPLNDLLAGHRKRILQEFKNDPALEEIDAATIDLSRAKGASIGNVAPGEYFDILSRRYADPEPIVDLDIQEPEFPEEAPISPQPTTSSPMAKSNVQAASTKSSKYKPKKVGSPASGYRYNVGKPAKGSITRKKHKNNFEPGGVLPDVASAYYNDPDMVREDGFAGVEAKSKGLDWGNIGNTAVTVAPNVVNAFLQKRLKGPATPSLETDLKLQRMSADPQLAETARAYQQAKGVITANTSQGSNLTSAVGNLLSKRLSAQNQLYGDINNLNTQIGNQEAGMNQAVRARNIERTNQFKNNQVDFANRKLAMTSENVANLSGKLQQMRKERNLQKKDQQSLEFLQSAYGDSGVLNRLQEQNPELFESVQKALGNSNKFGGKLKKSSTKRNKK